METYLREKASIISSDHGVAINGPWGAVTNWSVINNIQEKEVEPIHEFFKNPGQVLDFDCRPDNCTVKHQSGKYEQVNLLSLLIHLWDGKYTYQLKKMNSAR